MTLEVDDDGWVIDTPQRGTPLSRPRYRGGEAHTLLLQIAFDRIATSDPPKLISIAAEAESLRVRARLNGDPALERSAQVIVERAERRLAWFKRQEAKAS
jgi:hypothetical protein